MFILNILVRFYIWCMFHLKLLLLMGELLMNVKERVFSLKVDPAIITRKNAKD